jgi:ribosomal protein S13
MKGVGQRMSRKIIKQIAVDTQALNEYLKVHNMDYKKLAEITGMSTTQAFNLTKKAVGGSVTLGYLIGLNIPLFLKERPSEFGS